jgi:hypothetical protein
MKAFLPKNRAAKAIVYTGSVFNKIDALTGPIILSPEKNVMKPVATDAPEPTSLSNPLMVKVLEGPPVMQRNNPNIIVPLKRLYKLTI